MVQQQQLPWTNLTILQTKINTARRSARLQMLLTLRFIKNVKNYEESLHILEEKESFVSYFVTNRYCDKKKNLKF
jgi:hypothetical protein